MFSTRFLSAKPFRSVINSFKARGAHPDLLAGVDARKSQQNGHSLVSLEDFVERWRKRTPGLETVNVVFWLGKDGALQEFKESFSLEDSESNVKKKLGKLFHVVGVTEDFDLGRNDKGARQPETFVDAMVAAESARRTFNNMYPVMKTALEMLRRYGVFICLQPANGVVFGMSEPERTEGIDLFYKDRGMKQFSSESVTPDSLKGLIDIVRNLSKTYETYRGHSIRTGVTVILSECVQEHMLSADSCIVLAIRQPYQTMEMFLLALSAQQWSACQDASRKYRFENATTLDEWKRKGKYLAKIFNVRQFHASLRPTTSPTIVNDFLQRMLSGEGKIRGAQNKYVELRNPMLLEYVSVQMEYNLHNKLDFVVNTQGDIQVASHITCEQMLRILKDHGNGAAQKAKLMISLQTERAALNRLYPQFDIQIDPTLNEKRPEDCLACAIHFVKNLRAANLPRVPTSSQEGPLVLAVSDQFKVLDHGKLIYVPWDLSKDKMSSMLLR